MTAPEHQHKNKYDLLCMGMFAYRVVEKPEFLRLKPPQPPEYLPLIADARRGEPYVIARKRYESLVRIHIRFHLEHGITKYVPDDVREQWAKRTFEECKPKIAEFWREYGEYLKAQDWVVVKPKRELHLHCEWLVRFVVLDERLGPIAEKVDRKQGISEQAIGKAVRAAAELVGVTLPEHRGRK